MASKQSAPPIATGTPVETGAAALVSGDDKKASPPSVTGTPVAAEAPDSGDGAKASPLVAAGTPIVDGVLVPSDAASGTVTSVVEQAPVRSMGQDIIDGINAQGKKLTAEAQRLLENSKHVTVVVPQGASGGSVLEITTPKGNKERVVVPEGLKPGDKFLHCIKGTADRLGLTKGKPVSYTPNIPPPTCGVFLSTDYFVDGTYSPYNIDLHANFFSHLNRH